MQDQQVSESGQLVQWQQVVIAKHHVVDLYQAAKFSQQLIMKETGFSEHTVVDWENFCREAAFEIIENCDFQQLGGPRCIVEIDETLVGKRKYNKGKKRACQTWVFGGVERGTDKCFAVQVAQRDAATLVPIIKKYVAAGTTIHSDCWKAYSSLGKAGYKHLTVNHSLTFVDGEVHTNQVEGMWKHLKANLPCTNRRKELLPGYIGDLISV